MKGARKSFSFTTQDSIQITINHHHKPPPKTKPQYAQVRNIAWKHNLHFKEDKLTYIQREVFKIERGQFSLPELIRPIPRKNKTTRRTNPPTIPTENKAQPTLKLNYSPSN